MIANVLVTGGGGFIGSHLVSRLANAGVKVAAIDLAFPEIRRPWWGKATELITRDVGDAAWLVGEFDYVYHLAADMGGVGYFHSDADAPAATRNMKTDLAVIEACEASSVEMFYASSACAYPSAPVSLYEELLGDGPADQLYGEEKRFITLLLASKPWARVGVFHTIYGPGQEATGPRAKFPPAICHKVKNANGAPIEIWGDGSQMRTFLYIDDALEKILMVAGSENYRGPVNIGSDEEITVLECAEHLCAHAGLEPRFAFNETKPTGVLGRGCDNSKFSLLYGRDNLISPREGLVKLYEWL